ncbi:hypothetical protein SRB5_49770 [Streptomyces sp. RB5]|uniref:Uncharacterized protein n=1 Tax=Streptomyces smaragdinus TaxID=2585196 RepID=A0A7K0CN13_9ACTN|nr:hypothetical protein [Streptomyces smaragdinus]
MSLNAGDCGTHLITTRGCPTAHACTPSGPGTELSDPPAILRNVPYPTTYPAADQEWTTELHTAVEAAAIEPPGAPLDPPQWYGAYLRGHFPQA